MSPFVRSLPILAVLALAGCATNDTASYSPGPILGAMTPSATDMSLPTDQPVTTAPPPSQAVASGVSSLDVSAFTDSNGLKLMGPQARSEAGSAQYYALQFGRVGAARTWTGENSVTGSINVGPFVKVNNRDCRDFTNVVNVGPKSYTKRGTACRGDDGQWSVGSATAAAPSMTPPPAASGVGAQG